MANAGAADDAGKDYIGYAEGLNQQRRQPAVLVHRGL
jgi:hypothetical protein